MCRVATESEGDIMSKVLVAIVACLVMTVVLVSGGLALLISVPPDEDGFGYCNE